MNRERLRNEIKKGSVGESKPLRSKHLDTLGVLSDYSKENSRLEEENRNLLQQIQNLQNRSAGVGTLPEYIKDMEATFKEMNNENALLQKQLSAEKQKNAQLTSQNQTLTQQQEEMYALRDKDSKATANSRNQLQSELSQYRAKVDILNHDNKILEDRLHEAGMLLKAKTSVEETHLAQIRDLELQNEELSRKLESGDEKASRLREKMRKSKTELSAKQLQDLLNKANVSIAKLEAAAKKTAEERDALRAELDKLKENSKRARRNSQSSLNGTRGMLEEMKLQNAKLTEQVATLTRLLDAEQIKSSRLADEVETLLAKIQSLQQSQQGENAGMNKKAMFAEYVQLKRENERLQGIIRQMQQQMNAAGLSKKRSGKSNRAGITGAMAGFKQKPGSLPNV